MTSVPQLSLETTRQALAACALAVTAYFDGVFLSLESVREQLVAAFSERSAVSSATAGELVRPGALEVLEQHPVVGAGYVAAPGALSDRTHYLAWWQGEDARLLAERGVPIGQHVFDYTRHEWFRTPLATGERHVTGPYVDYVCTDEYGLTATAPVVVGGRTVGVVGADTTLETFERLMLPTLAEAGAVLVNDHDRCVLAADPLLPPGERVATAAHPLAMPCAGLPLRVLGPAGSPPPAGQDGSGFST